MSPNPQLRKIKTLDPKYKVFMSKSNTHRKKQYSFKAKEKDWIGKVRGHDNIKGKTVK